MQVEILRLLRDKGKVSIKALKSKFGEKVEVDLDKLEQAGIIVKDGKSYKRKCV